MNKRSITIVIAAMGLAAAACSVEAAPAAQTSAPGRANRDVQGIQVPVQTPAPGDPYFYNWPNGVQSTPAPADPYFYNWPGGVQPTPAPGEDFQSLLTSRKDGRAPSFANGSKAPVEDYQSLHATYNHLKR
jgi:hypothetical protein